MIILLEKPQEPVECNARRLGEHMGRNMEGVI